MVTLKVHFQCTLFNNLWNVVKGTACEALPKRFGTSDHFSPPYLFSLYSFSVFCLYFFFFSSLSSIVRAGLYRRGMPSTAEQGGGGGGGGRRGRGQQLEPWKPFQYLSHAALPSSMVTHQNPNKQGRISPSFKIPVPWKGTVKRQFLPHFLRGPRVRPSIGGLTVLCGRPKTGADELVYAVSSSGSAPQDRSSHRLGERRGKQTRGWLR